MDEAHTGLQKNAEGLVGSHMALCDARRDFANMFHALDTTLDSAALYTSKAKPASTHH